MKSSLVLLAAFFLSTSALAGQSAQHIHQTEIDSYSTTVFSELYVRITNEGSRQSIRYSADQVTADALCVSFYSPTSHSKSWTAEGSVQATPVMKLDPQGQLTQDMSLKYLNTLECVN